MVRRSNNKHFMSPYGGLYDPLVLNQIERMVGNLSTISRRFSSKLTDRRRDIDQECGYLKTEELTAQEYRAMYEREPIASRVVELEPLETWKVQPAVYETEDSGAATPFEDAWDEVTTGMVGNRWYKSEESNPVWDYFRRADILSGIGSYGVMLLGFDDVDGQTVTLKDPVEGIDPKTGDWDGVKRERKLLFIRVFDESLARISKYETDVNSPRYGQPIEYAIDFTDPINRQMGQGVTISTQFVHWHRVIHNADNLGSSEVFGTPRMRPVWNSLCDIRKVRGGSAEMYWLGAFFGISFETNPQLGGDVEVDSAEMEDSVEEYMNGLQRWLLLKGVVAKPIAPTVVDPTSQLEVQVDAICVQKGCPKRIFKGSERGELASSQDERAWQSRIRGRQTGYVTPKMIVPFVDRLIKAGVLPEPKEFHVAWPSMDALTEAERVDIMVKVVQAITAYMQGGGPNMLAPMDFWTQLGKTEEEAEAIISNVADFLGEANPEAEDVVPDHGPVQPEPEVGAEVEPGQEQPPEE